MKTTTTSALSESMTSTIHLPQMSMRFGDGFRQFMASSPAIDDEPEPMKQHKEFL